MAKPNYQFEKRQREIAKKKKQEEKRLRKTSKPDEATPSDIVTDTTPGNPPAVPS